MSAESAAVQKNIRKYMMIGGALYLATIITVGASYLQVGIAVGIVVALLIATVKGSMVAAVFMHLSDEKNWIYGSLLLTVFFFVALMLLPMLTGADAIGVHAPAIGIPDAPAAEHAVH